MGHRARRPWVVSVMKFTLTIYTQNSVNINKSSDNISMVRIIEFVF